jgi:hypothetical protein
LIHKESYNTRQEAKTAIFEYIVIFYNRHHLREKKKMGIANFSIRLLMREGNREKFSGKVLQLGNQEVLTTEKRLEKTAQEENFKLLEANCDIGYGKSKFSDATTVSSKYFFQRLGFKTVDALDFSDFEGANIVHDLNVPCNKDFKNIGDYNLIFDGGTIEHIFSMPNILKNIFDLLSVGGRIMHSAPVNMFNHGFYNYSTCFFEDFYSCNNFLINECAIIKWTERTWPDNAFYTLGDRNSQFIRSLNPTTFDGATFAINFTATKIHKSTGDHIPQQGDYLIAWNPSSDRADPHNSGLVHGNTLLKSIYRKLNTIPILKTLMPSLRDKYKNSLVNWETI